MFFKMHHTFFLFNLIFSTILAISSNSWMFAWLGLEINLMSMIPLILVKLNKNLSEASIKYFIPQALASLGLIIASSFILNNQSMNFVHYLNLIITIAISIKAGVAPFHFWFPQISKLINWLQCMMIFTWQKIAPLFFLSFSNSSAVVILAMFSAALGALGGLNQNNLKVLLSFSSISHAGWMINSCKLNILSWVIYFSIYSIISLNLMVLFLKFNMHKISMLSSIVKKKIVNFIIPLNMFSLGGLPPFTGFLAKMSIIAILIKYQLMSLLFVLIMSSLISLFFYFRLIYSSSVIFSSKMNLIYPKESFSIKVISFMTIFVNIFFPLIIIFT